MKRLYRSGSRQMLGGVCAGLAAYFDTDVTLIRLIWVLAAFFGGSGLLAYIIAWLIIPEEPGALQVLDDPDRASGPDTRLIGIIIIVVGFFLLLRNIFPVLFLRPFFWPVILIVAGLVLVFGGLRGEKQ